MERVKQRLDVARQALDTLKEALARPKDPIVRDAAIQRFEYTFELAWKAAQTYLKFHESVDAGSPKAAIRSSFQVGLLNEEQARVALSMADDRNLTVHTYNESLAEQIYSRLQNHAAIIEEWLAAIESGISE